MTRDKWGLALPLNRESAQQLETTEDVPAPICRTNTVFAETGTGTVHESKLTPDCRRGTEPVPVSSRTRE